MGATLKGRRWRLRTLVIAAVVLACVGANIAWRMTHRRDPRLVGSWIVTSEPPSEWKEEWEFIGDGTGNRIQRREYRENGYTVKALTEDFCWWTNGEQLSLKWGTNSPRRRWEWVYEMATQFDCAFHGRPEPYPVHRYLFIAETERLIRVKPAGEPTNPGYESMRFTRVGSD